jgi:hypothetical protein
MCYALCSSYVSVLKWLTVSLFAYFGTVMGRRYSLARGGAGPLYTHGFHKFDILDVRGRHPWDHYQPISVFWQAAQEVEDVEATPIREPLKYAPHQAESALERIRLDTYFGMAFRISLRLRSSLRPPRLCISMESPTSKPQVRRPKRFAP